MAEYLVNHSGLGRVRVQLDEPISDQNQLNTALQAKIRKGDYTALETDAQPKSILARADKAYRDAAEMATNVVGGVASSGLQGIGVPQSYADPIGHGAARFLIPQTPLEAGLMVGTMGAGGLAAKAGMTGAKAIGTRLAGGILGGAAGGAVSEDPGMGALTGAATGAATGIVGEGVGMTLSAVSKRMMTLLRGGSQAVVAKAQVKAALEVGKAFDSMPELASLTIGPAGLTRNESVFAGYNTSESIRDLVKSGKGHRILSDAYEEGLNLVQSRLPAGAKFTNPLDPRSHIPFMEAKKELSKLRERAFSPKQANPETANIMGQDAKEMFDTANKTIRSELATQDPTGVASAVFDATQTLYRTGYNLLKSLAPAFRQKESDRIVFNVATLQGHYADKQRQLQRSLTQPVYDKMTQALRIAGRIGMQDEAGTTMPIAVGARLPIPGAAYAREGLSKILQGPPRLVGDQPARGIARTGINVLSGRAGAPVAEDILNEIKD